MRKSMHKWFLAMAMTMLIVLGIPAALSADSQVARKEAGLQSYPVAGSSTQIYKGAFVCLNTSGYLVAGADTAGLRYAGVAYENVLNAGSDGDKSCKVHTNGVFLKPASSITQAMVGRMMYLVDDDTFDDSQSDVPVGVLVRFESTTSGWIDIGQRDLLTGFQDHVYIGTDLATKTVKLNSKTFTTDASIIGTQTKPRAGVNQTNDVIGMESMPGLGATAITSTQGIVCYKAEPYIHATAGAITGDVRGYEASLGCPAGAGTITGVLSALKAINNTAKAVTGGIYVIHAPIAGDAQPWSGLALLPDDGQMASSSENPSTINGWIKVKIGTAVRYIATYDSPTGG
jgi:hypothetical protein